MKKLSELKLLGIKREKIDNGYRVAPTWQYTSMTSNLLIELDKDSDFGERIFLVSVNGKLIENYFGKVMKWDSVESVEQDIIDIFEGKAPSRFYTTIY